MSRKRVVMGQTGTTVLSDKMAQHKRPRRRTVRYRYVRHWFGWRAEIIGPFHDRTYGVCGFGTRKARAKEALIGRLVCDYGYAGNLIFSDDDTSDTVGIVDVRLQD